jgi:hypothetical protein
MRILESRNRPRAMEMRCFCPTESLLIAAVPNLVWYPSGSDTIKSCIPATRATLSTSSAFVSGLLYVYLLQTYFGLDANGFGACCKLISGVLKTSFGFVANYFWACVNLVRACCELTSVLL